MTISVMVPMLQGVGTDLLAAHTFVFFCFGGADVITPPVAITAYAAALVSGGWPIAAAVEATRISAMVLLIPFASALDGSLLLRLGDGGARQILLKLEFLIAALFFFKSALVGHACRVRGIAERLLSFAVAIACLSPMLWAELAGLFVGIALLTFGLITSCAKERVTK